MSEPEVIGANETQDEVSVEFGESGFVVIAVRQAFSAHAVVRADSHACKSFMQSPVSLTCWWVEVELY